MKQGNAYLLAIVLTIILSVCSTSIMSYIAMATPIGPWIAPTLVLIVTLLLKFFSVKKSYTTITSLSVAGGSIGGIVATACGFSFPTLFFLNKTLFNQWLSNPFYFSVLLGSLTLVAGLFGFMIADFLEQSCIEKEQMPFPIGQLVYTMIASQNNMRKAYELMVGFVSTIFFTMLQGFYKIPSLIPTSFRLLQTHTFWVIKIPALDIRLDVLPMLLAIGFITGHVIALPLFIGALSKIIVIDPLNNLFFKSVTNSDFIFAFSSGIVISSAAQSLFDVPMLFRSLIKQIAYRITLKPWRVKFYPGFITVPLMEFFLVLGFAFLFLTTLHFSLFSQVYVLMATAVCTYQIVIIAGKIGMAQLGRFATFVMLPALLFFGADPLKVTIIASFVEISGGVAADVLFGRKMGSLGAINSRHVRLFQLLGLLISSCCIGIIFWLLINHLGLGSAQLVAQRAQARALLINFSHFNWYIVTGGCLFGFVLKRYKLNPMLVLGGLLMPLNYSLGLMIGGFIAFLVKKREEWEPFWSGMFAANSIMELLKTIV